MLPNFLVIGAAKAGSTSLYAYLRKHPDVFMPEPKELDFFVVEKNWRLGLDWYEHQFEEADQTRAIGEASVRYTMYPWHNGVPGRIAALLPDAQLIYIVRHPIARMVSHYRHLVRVNHEHDSLDHALLTNPFYLDTSRYAFQLEQYLEFFPLEQVMVVTSEQLREKRRDTLANVLDFLGVPAEIEGESIAAEYNVTTKGAPKRVTRTLMRVPGWNTFASSTPDSVKRLVRRISHHRPPPTDLSKAAVQELERRLCDDVVRMRQYVRGEFDGWGIA